MKEEMLKLSRETDIDFRAIFDIVCEKNLDAAHNLNYESLRHTLRRTRERERNQLPSPAVVAIENEVINLNQNDITPVKSPSLMFKKVSGMAKVFMNLKRIKRKTTKDRIEDCNETLTTVPSTIEKEYIVNSELNEYKKKCRAHEILLSEYKENSQKQDEKLFEYKQRYEKQEKLLSEYKERIEIQDIMLSEYKEKYQKQTAVLTDQTTKLVTLRNDLELQKQINEDLNNTKEHLQALTYKMDKECRILHSDIQKLKGNIKVWCRIRPRTRKEVEQMKA